MKKATEVCRLVLSAALIMLSVGQLSAATADISGNWKAKTTSAQGSSEQSMTIKQNGDTFTGEMTTSQGAKESIRDGKISGDNIEFSIERKRPNGDTAMVPYKGKVSGNQITGTFVGATGRDIEWQATKE